MIQHKNYKNVWEVPKDFPQFDVIDAFINPEVEESEIKLKWRTPDFDNIKIFCKDIIEMDPREIELFLEPLQKEFDLRKNEVKITHFFEEGKKIGNVVSTRLAAAVENLKKKQEMGEDAYIESIKIEKNKKNIREKKKSKKTKREKKMKR